MPVLARCPVVAAFRGLVGLSSDMEYCSHEAQLCKLSVGVLECGT